MFELLVRLREGGGAVDAATVAIDAGVDDSLLDRRCRGIGRAGVHGQLRWFRVLPAAVSAAQHLRADPRTPRLSHGTPPRQENRLYWTAPIGRRFAVVCGQFEGWISCVPGKCRADLRI